MSVCVSVNVCVVSVQPMHAKTDSPRTKEADCTICTAKLVQKKWQLGEQNQNRPPG